MYTVKIYLTRERKRSAPKRSLLLKFEAEENELEHINEMYQWPFEAVIKRIGRGK